MDKVAIKVVNDKDEPKEKPKVNKDFFETKPKKIIKIKKQKK